MTKAVEGAVKGRPSLYSDKIADTIVEKLSQGQTLTSICKEPNMPTIRTIQYWAAERPNFFAMISRAREAGAEHLIGELQDKMVTLVEMSENEDETKLPPKERMEALRLYAGHVQWMTARMNPRRYSERVLAEMAKQPEPAVEKAPPIDWDYLTSDERETLLQLTQIAEERRAGMLTEEAEEGEQSDGTGQ